MRYKIFPLFVIVLVCAFFTAAQTVVESESSVVISDKTANVSLVIESGKSIALPVKIELLDPEGKVRSSVSKIQTLSSGKNPYTFGLPLETVDTKTENLAWYRLRYRVGDSAGIVSMTQLIRDLFELRIIASDEVLAGMTYRVRVRAVNPFTASPMQGVQIAIAVELDLKESPEKKLILNGSGETDVEGFAVSDFTIPPEAKLDDDAEIKVTGIKNGIIREANDDLQTLRGDVQFVMMTDKPIYQPEQLVNIRGLLLKGAEGKTVLADSEVEFRITDEDDTTLFREKVRSSTFGVASASWKIPANVKLGDYSIQVRDADNDQIGGKRIKISRYDLPNFVVTAKPSKPYYVPGENEAEVEVRADYLFGKPVNKGKVRVVEETSREWNWKEQKYDINEGQVREGETESDGKFTAKFDLKQKHDDIKDDKWRKYEDIHFAAYFTDPTTNKTEQRRFDIRVTREPIHVYFIQNNSQNGELPVNAYVSTFYADGTPAQCDVEIKASEENEDKFKTYARLKTNSFGAGRVNMPRPKIGDPEDDLDFKIVARDEEGHIGTWADNVYFNDDDAIELTTDRSIYKPGETMTVSVRSTIKDAPLYLDVVNGWSVIDSRFARLKNGRAEVRIPYEDSFKGEIKVAAFVEDPDDEDKTIRASRGVIFPARQGIDVQANFDKAVYKPSEEATINFGVSDRGGHSLETALGIVVLDKAVEERARTDADFGGIWRDYSGWLGYGGSFGGINVKDLNELDLTKSISADMQLVAEVILHDNYYSPNIFRSEDYYKEAKTVFAGPIQKQFDAVSAALKDTYEKKGYIHPVNDAELRKILAGYKIDIDEFHDPWGMPYHAKFSIAKEKDVISIDSAGPDKQFGTDDDFVAFTTGFDYFTPIGKAIDTSVRNYHERTGKFIRDEKTLLAELGMREILDRFGHPYKIIFDGEGRYLITRLRSCGPDGKCEDYDWRGDDFQVWTSKIDYFADADKKIAEIESALKQTPMSEAEFRASLKAGGVDLDGLKDGWGNELYVLVLKTSRYWDKITIENVQNYGETQRSERRIITPVTQQIIQFTIRSNGRDGRIGTYDDLTLTQVVHVLSEQRKDDPKPIPVIKPIAFRTDSNGSIAGKVTDANGAAVPNATVTATGASTGVSHTAKTSDSGDYLIAALNPENYTVKVTANGFKDSVLQNIPVKANATAQANIVLEAGSVSETVDVSAAPVETQTSNSSVVNTRQIQDLPINGRNVSSLLLLMPGAVKVVTKSGTSDDGTQTDPNSTPRLREYFPETLLWQPELITDASGKAQIKFRMADNITTWKMYTIASTKNGKVGVAEKEVTAFQPFFVDLDPPKFLTEGDEIYLPTQVRNYTDKSQKVDVSMDKADWFSMLNADKLQINVAAGDSQNAVFGFKTTATVKDGKQRVTAMAQTDSDAIEKPVTVKPNGQEIVHTDSDLFTGNEKIALSFPSNALPKTQKAELKIYPNLYAQISDSIEGLLERPYGCGEQTISSTYPNLMILKFVKPDSALGGKAKKYLQKGYERLLGYQAADGGFSYWGGKDSADIGLTAYALRFLTEASSQIDVDQEVVKKAQTWLLKQQHADGGWTQRYRWENNDDPSRAKITTTYVARSMSMLTKLRAATQSNSDADQALKKALAYLKSRNAEIDEPYALALFGLASMDAGDDATAAAVAKTLESMAIGEGSAVYWKLETNTPFYGWGTAGRVETTALVTQLLLRVSQKDPSAQRHDLINKATLFLLKNKDRYGVWYSTQTTINVLDAFLATLGTEKQAGPQKLDVIVNGEVFKTLDVAPDQVEATSLDLTGKVNSNGNNIEVRSSGNSPIMTQLVASHYVDWKDSTASNLNVNQSRAVRLDYKCDKQNAAIMQEVNCSVRAERIGFSGYGMLLAEIGTPPGADVDRESLEKAIESDWSISHYEVLPDRIIVYMWSKAGGTNFSFKFRPRYGINAQTPASVVYDYYNPEAQAIVAPLRFVVK